MPKISLLILFSASFVQVYAQVKKYFFDNTNKGVASAGPGITGVTISGLSKCVLIYFAGPVIPNGVSLTIYSVTLSMASSASTFPPLDIRLCAQNGNFNPALFTIAQP